MKHKPIRIDWDDLETAFNNKNEELVYYLDTVTGHVLLEGEGEEDDFDDDDRAPRPMNPGGSNPSDTTRLYVEPPGHDVEVGWMTEFLSQAQDLDGDATERLVAALETDDPIDAFRDELRDSAEARDSWFRYRSDRLRGFIDTWLAGHEVLAAEPPPWKE